MAKKPLSFSGNWVNVGKGVETFTYEKKVRVQVGTGPRGGKVYETRIEQVSSDERHGYNTVTHERIPLRQLQNIQHENRANAGIPKQPAIPRKGKTRTIHGRNGEGFGYQDPNVHGDLVKIYFTDLESARNYVLTEGIPEGFNNVVIQVHYREKVVATTKVVNGVRIANGSPRNKKRGYATLTPFKNAETMEEGADYLSPDRHGEVENPWYTAEQNLRDYRLDDQSRIILVMSER